MRSFLKVASLRGSPRHRKLVLLESRLKRHRMSTAGLLGIRRTEVTNQVTTTPGNTRRSATFADINI